MNLKHIIAATFTLAATFTGCFAASTNSSKNDIARNIDLFTSVYRLLQTNYVDTINADKTMKHAIDAMLYEIDPYTVYIPAEEQEDFMTIHTGEFGGIGAYIQQLPSKETMISEPQRNTPAALAGLKAGDVILTIDGDSVTTIGSDKVRERLRGQAGTTFNLTVRRPFAEDSILSFDITRAKIEVETLPYYGVVRDSIGYISLSTFNEKSAPEVEAALKELLADPRVKGIALDLRGNTGGLLESAIDIVGMFVPKGTEVLRTRGRNITNERIYKTSSKPIAENIPLAVLIDESTASAAEITAGALQDLDRAVIIGERSFGKGLVQSTHQLPNNGLLKVTIAKYYIPSGRLIQAIDYSERNPDGSPKVIPDSLRNTFHTRAGRPVLDGGGITPDVKIDYPETTRLVYNLVSDRWCFDYATRYAATHPEVPSPETFEINDEIFGDFKASINPEKFQYDKDFETYLEEFKKVAKKEGYMTDEVNTKIDELTALLKHDLNHDLDLNRDQIALYLAPEILKRYYYSPGGIIYVLRYDPVIDSATSILTSPSTLTSILSPKK